MAKKRLPAASPGAGDFEHIVGLIKDAHARTLRTVNAALIDLYWEIGRVVSEKVKNGGWGQSVVEELARYIAAHYGNPRGFSAQNIWRMKQFYETYRDDQILSPLVRELPWTNNLLILSRTKSEAEREFYINLAIEEKYSKRELDRQITAMRFERAALTGVRTDAAAAKAGGRNAAAPPVMERIRERFLDAYVLEFLKLPEKFPESTLRGAIINNMKDFILEIGKDFTFVGAEYPVQVGKIDFFVDLLFYHRGLSCLVAFELKTGSFKPEYLGKMNFYLEALDEFHKKPGENPSVGIILCADKDDEVVEFALRRSLSPVLIAEYTAKLPDKQLLRNKLRELSVLAQDMDDGAAEGDT